MIVLDQQQKDFLVNFLNDYKEEMLHNGLIIQPIEIKNNLWILPEEVLNDSRCEKVKQALISGGHLAKMVVREVQQNEFISYSI